MPGGEGRGCEERARENSERGERERTRNSDKIEKEMERERRVVNQEEEEGTEAVEGPALGPVANDDGVEVHVVRREVPLVVRAL